MRVRCPAASPFGLRFPWLRSRLPGILAFGLIAVGLGGCGGSSSEDPGPSGFVSAADAICRSYAAGSVNLERQFTRALRSGDLDSSASDFSEQAETNGKMLDELEQLEVPTAYQARMEELVALGRQRVELAATVSEALLSEDKDAMFETGREGMRLTGRYDRLAGQLGIEDCRGSGSGVEELSRTGTTSP